MCGFGLMIAASGSLVRADALVGTGYEGLMRAQPTDPTCSCWLIQLPRQVLKGGENFLCH